MEVKRKYRRWLCVVFAVYLCVFILYVYQFICQSVPDTWKIQAGEETSLDLDFPFSVFSGEEAAVINVDGKRVPDNEITIDIGRPVSMRMWEPGTYQINVRWLGLPIKDVEVSVVEEKKLMPLGVPVGIYIRTQGVMVLGTGPVTDMQGIKNEPAKGVLRSGDYILSVNGEPVESTDQFIQMLKENGTEEVSLEISRDGGSLITAIQPIQTGEEEYKLGIWIRQDTQGIGTVSYVDENGHFGALGHGITDVDTSQIIKIRSGRLYTSNILSIIKGKSGTPGEMVGNINYRTGTVLGSVEENTSEGIFGVISDKSLAYDESKALPVGYKQDVKTGEACIRCCVDGEVKDYTIEIESVDLNSREKNRDMVIRITDQELLSKTNGIIQGMSGSPIMQEGKIIGVVTHVFLNDPSKGYGIFIENMAGNM
ncbi:MAG TPA: SpoIVB peptidase [Candidatus Onthocola gallistercoris]|uniref:SpoIVB peptidase n=1 Tax=Candidatus Onthocola gallistercoris TaxID=2840876 RepID=A0A9D1KWP6_9FIRM|nr:SpoIVB peptidase [Candidatus Onthocola gallistercoris]